MSNTAHPSYSQVSPSMARPSISYVGQSAPVSAPESELADSDRAPATNAGCLSVITTTQALIALGKYVSGYRPGHDGWTPEDNAAMSAAMGGRATATSAAALPPCKDDVWPAGLAPRTCFRCGMGPCDRAAAKGAAGQEGGA